MTCRELADFIADYLSGELPADTRQAFDRHLTLCANCAAYLANYQAATSLGRQVCLDNDEPVPADVPRELVDAILASRRRHRET